MLKRDILRKKSISAILNDARLGVHADGEPNKLTRTLKARDLTAMGIAAIVGAGIFSTIGNAAFDGGPAVALLFVFTAIACAFSALCYAEFASMLPVSGSAYTYAYVTFGELIAWIIGWDLVLEYAIGNIAVAVSWSDYFTSLANFFLHKYDLGQIPHYLTLDYFSAANASARIAELTAAGQSIPTPVLEAQQAWIHAPSIGGLRFIVDIPALFIVAFITWLVYTGIKESRNASNIMVLIKLAIILVVIIAGSFFVDTDNWSDFAPNGITGVLKGVSAVFFAYIGFDAISTTAEETENPQRDLPRGIIYSLIICTVLYVAISLVITGMVNYSELQVGDPLAYVFEKVGMPRLSILVAFSAVVAMASVLLVFQLGQPRILMSMSRDGLLPKGLSKVHKKYRTPSTATIVTGFVVAIPALFLNLTQLTDLTSIGTLFAFVLVCGGVLILQDSPDAVHRKFKVPYVNGKYIVPILLLGVLAGLIIYYGSVTELLGINGAADLLEWHILKHKLALFLFIIVAIIVSVYSFMRNYSLIPVLGLLSCLYLMSQLEYENWERFAIWLVIGLVIYMLFGYKNSRLNRENLK